MASLSLHSMRPLLVGAALFLSGTLFSTLLLPRTCGVVSSKTEAGGGGGIGVIAKRSSAMEIANKRLLNETSETNRAILFVHFHKAGGSSVCETVIKSGRVELTDMNGLKRRPLRNCNVELTGPKNDVSMYHSMHTCRMLELYTADLDDRRPFRRNNFLGIEVPLIEPLPCPVFRSFAIMRRPVDRAISHLRWDGIDPKDMVTWMDERTKSPKDTYMRGYPVVNSFVIRMLLGRDRYVDPKPVDESDLEQAKRRVDEFDAFVPLEYLHHDQVLRLLNQTVPEYYEGLISHPNIKAKKQKKKDNGEFPNISKRLEEANIYDTMLYQYVLEKMGIEANEYG